MREKEIFDVPSSEAERIQSECGLFAVLLTDPRSIDIRPIAYQGGTDLQHRAEGSAGMWISNGRSSASVRELGTVAVAFQEGRNTPSLDNPHIAILHSRYPTAGGSNHKPNIQPLSLDGITLAHHGNLTNAPEIENRTGTVPKGGKLPDSDSWIALNAITQESGSLVEKVVNAQRSFEGGWAFIVTDGKQIVASRDPNGIRPLSVAVLGEENNPKGFLLSVESCVFNKMEVSSFREVLPGETITVDESGVKTVDINPKAQMSCIFELVYMMRPDSKFLGEIVYKTRREAGRLLWKEAPVKVGSDEKLVIMSVPNSGRPAGLGFFQEAQKELGLQVTYDEGVLSNAYFGRNFIKPTGQRKANLKFYPIREILEDKVVVLVDDSIVRGDTTSALVEMCLSAGAKSVHERVASPPIRHPCHWGVAMPTYKELLANRIPDIKDRGQYLGVSSLGHLSIDGLIEAVGVDKNKLCTHCFDGKGPPLKKLGTVPLRE